MVGYTFDQMLKPQISNNHWWCLGNYQCARNSVLFMLFGSP